MTFIWSCSESSLLLIEKNSPFCARVTSERRLRISILLQRTLHLSKFSLSLRSSQVSLKASRRLSTLHLRWEISSLLSRLCERVLVQSRSCLMLFLIFLLKREFASLREMSSLSLLKRVDWSSSNASSSKSFSDLRFFLLYFLFLWLCVLFEICLMLSELCSF